MNAHGQETIKEPVSIYIPLLPKCISEDMLQVEFSFTIGVVDRVDFTPVNKKHPGFEENMTGDVVSAFVHFSEYFGNIPTIINDGHYYPYYPYSLSGRFTHQFKFWKLLPAKAPLQKTMMNNSQIVANCRLLEERVKAQAETIETLGKKLVNVTETVYQLVGGLFHQKNQGEAIDYHTGMLYGFTPNRVEREEEEEYDDKLLWPTTRQGDENQERIMKLENALGQIMDFIRSTPSDGDKEEADGALLERKHMK
jgi:hypothetical protein